MKHHVHCLFNLKYLVWQAAEISENAECFFHVDDCTSCFTCITVKITYNQQT